MKQLTSSTRARVTWAGLFLTVLLIVAVLAGSGVRLRASTAMAAEPEVAAWYLCTPANVTTYTAFTSSDGCRSGRHSLLCLPDQG
jgi:hypothetical protein